jgi:hypothetical protein
VRPSLRGLPGPADAIALVALRDQDQRDAESGLASALLTSSAGKLDGGQVDLVLQLASRHGISLDIAQEPVRRQLEKFAIVWLDHPKAWDPRRWALHDEILDMAYQELRERFDGDGAAGLMGAIRATWPHFADRGDDPADPFYCHLQAAAIAGTKGERRMERLSASLARITLLRQAGQDPPRVLRAARYLQRALIEWRALGTDVAVAILTELDTAEIEPEITAHVEAHVAVAAGHPDAALLDMLASLHKLGWQPASEPAAALLTGELSYRAFRERAADKQIMKDLYLLETARLAASIAPAIIVLRSEGFLDALTSTQSPYLAGEVMCRIPAKGKEIVRYKPASTLIRLVGKRLRGYTELADQAEGTIWCLRVLAELAIDDKHRKRHENLSGALRGFALTLGRSQDRWRDEVTRQLKNEAQPTRAEWDRMFSPEARQGGMVQGLLRRQRP